MIAVNMLGNEWITKGNDQDKSCFEAQIRPEGGKLQQSSRFEGLQSFLPGNSQQLKVVVGRYSVGWA